MKHRNYNDNSDDDKKKDKRGYKAKGEEFSEIHECDWKVITDYYGIDTNSIRKE